MATYQEAVNWIAANCGSWRRNQLTGSLPVRMTAEIFSRPARRVVTDVHRCSGMRQAKRILSDRQTAIVEAVNSLTEKSGPPTTRQVRDLLGLKSAGSLHRDLIEIVGIGALALDRRQTELRIMIVKSE